MRLLIINPLGVDVYDSMTEVRPACSGAGD